MGFVSKMEKAKLGDGNTLLLLVMLAFILLGFVQALVFSIYKNKHSVTVAYLIRQLEHWILFQALLSTHLCGLNHLFLFDPNNSLYDKISHKKGLSFTKYVDSTSHIRVVISVMVSVCSAD